MVIANQRRAIRMYIVGALVRSLCCVVSWYQGKGTEFQYWTGLNEDSNRYFLNSYLPEDEAISTTEDPGFPAINSAITRTAEALGADHYLLNVQVPLIAGALFSVVVYGLGIVLECKGAASVAGWLVALHPIVIGWSVGLMRDTVVATAGWLMIYSVVRGTTTVGTARVAAYFIAIVGGAITWSLRSTNCLYLVLVTLVLIAFGDKTHARRGAARFAIYGCGACILLAMLFKYPAIRERSMAFWDYGTAARNDIGRKATAINEGGLSERIANSRTTVVYACAALYVFIAPFPVYSKPTDFLGDRGRFVDYMMNVGGFENLGLLIFYCLGLFAWLRQRKWGLFLAAGPMFYCTCLGFMLITSQSRWLMAFTYPLVFLTAGEAIAIIVNDGRHICSSAIGAFLVVGLVYIGYWLLKADCSMFITIAVCGTGLAAVGIMLLKGYLYALVRERA